MWLPSGSSASASCKYAFFVEGANFDLKNNLKHPRDPALESEKVGYIIIYASPSHLYLVSIYYAGRMKYALSLYLFISLHKPPSCFIFDPSYCLLLLNFFLLFLGVVTSSVSCDNYYCFYCSFEISSPATSSCHLPHLRVSSHPHLVWFPSLAQTLVIIRLFFCC